MKIQSDLEYIKHLEESNGIVRNLFIVNTNWGFTSLYKCDWIRPIYTAHCLNGSAFQILENLKSRILNSFWKYPTRLLSHIETHTFCYHSIMVLNGRHVFMLRSQLNSVLIFTVLIHKVAASPLLLVSNLFLSCKFSVYKLPGRQCDASIHMPAASRVCCLNSIQLRTEFCLSPEACIRLDCGRPDKLFSHWRFNVICQSHKNQMQKSKHTRTHSLSLSHTQRHAGTHPQHQHSNNSSCY